MTDSQDTNKQHQEPVAWMLEWTFNGEERGYRLYDDERHCIFDAESDGGVCRPLYTSPQRTWVGLTDEEKRQIFEREDYQGWLDYINAIEARLREKNT